MSLILFDFDGVLADTLADMLLFAQQVCDELRVKHMVVEADLTELEVMSFETLARACGTPEGLVDEFVRRCTGKFAARESPPAIFNGLAEVISEMAAPHVLAVVTGNTEENVWAFLQEHRLEGHFRAVYGLETAGSKAEKIAMARGRYAAGGAAAFMVGDSLSDIAAAKEAGARSVAVSWGHQSLSRLLGAAPDHVARTPEDLLEVARRG